ncbi:MAG: RNA recognition motif domain-containing protein [Armatimonadota bacterium]
MRLYVGNLSYSVTTEALRAAFAEFGEVTDAQVILDRDTGQSRGFGFVTMPNDADAQRAIEALNGTPLEGRPIVVNEARPRGTAPERRGTEYDW